MEIKVVNSGIDSLVVGFSIAEYKSPEAFRLLEDSKAKAGEKMFGGKGSSVTWHEREFMVKASGTKGYEWVLENADILLCIARKAQGGRVYPEIYITFRAEYLWRMGHVEAVKQSKEWIESWAVIKDNKVSRCDLCIDIQMDMPKIDLAIEAITRARNKVERDTLSCECHISGRHNKGYRIGSGALQARLYDKSLEITINQKEWFKTIWSANGWDGESKVIRVEFQARRSFLKEMSVDSFLSLCERLADMWRYYTCDWLTIRVPGADSHRHRWAVADWWQVAQAGFTLFGEACGVLRNKQHQYRYEHLMQQLRGLMKSATAVASNSNGIEYGCFKVGRDIQEILNSPDYKNDVKERMHLVATFSASEKTHLVDEIIRMGGQVVSIENIND